MRKSFTSVFRYYIKGVLPSLLNYLTFFMLRWRQKTMFWYAHVYFYLLYVLLVITQLFKTILKKENITVWITLISRKKVTSSFMYIHQRIYYLYPTFIFVEYNLNRSKKIISMKNTRFMKRSLTSSTKRTNPNSDFNFVSSHFIWLCCSQTCFCIFTTTAHSIIHLFLWYSQ